MMKNYVQIKNNDAAESYTEMENVCMSSKTQLSSSKPI